MKQAIKVGWVLFVLALAVACGSNIRKSPTPAPGFPILGGVQLGGGPQEPLRTRPGLPGDYCQAASPAGPTKPPDPFLYQPFEGRFDEQVWAAQMDHDRPDYRQNGVIATLGEKLRYDLKGPGLAGGTEAYQTSNKQWFGPDRSYEELVQQGYPILAYQSPSFESYLYYDGHDGHDFAVTGKALAAAAGGVVFKGDYGNALGRVVEIYHPNGYLTRYAHLASFENGLEVGSQVKAGQPIGTIGGSAVVDGHLTDNYWGVHLHFSVFRWTGSEWHITDPFGWDPWAGPDQPSHVRKQKEDPLVNCNGEVSYNLWVGGWPQPVGRTGMTTPFQPTQDRYVGGWLGESPTTGMPEQPAQSLPVVVLPFDYQEKAIGDGWKIAAVRLYFTNPSGDLIPPQSLQVTGASVETLQGKTYPADLIDPTSWYFPMLGAHREILEEYLSKGQFDWSNPKDIFLGEAAIGGKLGIPPGFPWVNAAAGFGSYQYAVGFRFAEAATPVRVILQLATFGDLALELKNVPQQVPDPYPAEVQARPLSELSTLRLDNEQFSFAWDGTCVWRIEGWVRNKMVYLPYRIINKNALDEQKIVLDFPYAVYYPGGMIHYHEESFEITVGPGQELRDLYLIALLISEDDPMPLYLIHYNQDNSITTFLLNCMEWKP
jgi:murein DD-endopeptidase MepM/ murein hydrolase activator NlpD